MAGLFEIVNILSVLLVGRRPRWTLQSLLTSAPAALDAGVALNDSPRAAVHIALREELHRKTARVRIVTGDAATTYNITVGGTTVSATGESDRENIVQELAGLLDASAPINALVTYSAESSDGVVVDTLVFKGKTPADVTFAANASGGAGALALTQDATTCSAKVYGLPGGVTPSSTQPQLPWCLVRNGDLGTLTEQGLTEGGLNVAGYKQLAVVITGADGQVRTWIGPAQQE